jgi:hypothetical protein
LARIASDVLPVIEPDIADTVEDPTATPVATPVVAPIVETAGVLDTQFAVVVTSAVLPSLNVPVATSCRGIPIPEYAGLGVTAMEASTTARGATAKVPLTLPTVAVIVADPADTACTSPVVGPTVATDGLFEVH